MPDLAPPVLEYLYNLSFKDRSPAFFLLEKDGRLMNWGGNPEAYGFTDLKKGEHMEERILLLEGLFPPDDEQMSLSCVTMESGISADVHIFSGEQGYYWLLLLDATLKEAHLVALQQEANELRLFRDRHLKMMNQYLAKKNSEKVFHLTLQEPGDSKYLSVLFADIRGFTSYSEKISPVRVLKSLDEYMTAIVRPVLDEGGVADKIMGDAVMGVFGILPGVSPSVQSVKAGFRMIKNVRSLNKVRQREKQDTFDIGIGIASGKAVLGIIGSWDRRKTLSVIGRYVNLASELEKQARPNEILIDENTFRAADDFQADFSKATLSLQGTDMPGQVFSYEAAEDDG
ncbi:adenylate/guanylate cyclase domain-containing protein [Desulfonema magnum]|uniref:Adenylyl/guanylyl cyclase domain-containing protein n=1 Tax=Desulfonema magnum TaxID=45655 RepID=A0A975BS08_9BACT|nr:adenylate/guanylate cyclase domain-containing protein [Desulfonema magnum]QTA90362.1 Adenylyl/guanylyl cyclase domain-containing protein [Desulfonema magnum]